MPRKHGHRILYIIQVGVCVCIIEKLNTLSFGYYKFISAGNSRETGFFGESSHNRERKKQKKKHMGLKFVSKRDVISLSGVMYPYVNKILHNSQNP